MNDNSQCGAAGFFIGFIMGILLCGSVFSCVLRYEKQKAIEAGVGRWVIHEKTGAVEFEYGVKK